MKILNIILGGALILLASCRNSDSADDASDSSSPTDPVAATVEKATAAPAVAVIKPDGQIPPADGKLIVVDFSATWCGPCRQFAPNFEKVAAALGSQASFYKVDVDENPRLAAEFNVQSIPTVIYIQPDGTVSRSMGYMDADQFEDAVKLRL